MFVMFVKPWIAVVMQRLKESSLLWRIWEAIVYSTLLDNRGEAEIEFSVLRSEKGNKPYAVTAEIGGCKVELHFAKALDRQLEPRILESLLGVMEKETEL